MNTSLLSSMDITKLMSLGTGQSQSQSQPNLQLNTTGLDAVLLPDGHTELIGKVNNLLNDTFESDDLLCDKECQQNRKEEQLYQSYINAKNNLTNAPKQLEIAERDFITFTKGSMEYQQQREKQYQKKAETIIQKLTKMYNTSYDQTSLLLNKYNDQKVYDNHISELTNTYGEKVKGLQSTIENTRSKYNVANRLTEYKDKWINIWKQINTYLDRVFLFLFFIFIIISIYYKKTNTKVFKYGFTIMLVLWIIPIISIIQRIYFYIYRLAE